MSAQGQPAEGAAPEITEAPATEAPTTTEAKPEGLDRLYGRMEEMAAQQRDMLSSIEALRPPEQEYEEELAPEDYYTPEGDLSEDGARALLSDLVADQVQQQLAPRERERLTAERDDAYEAFLDEHPELREDKDANNRLLARALDWANRVDPQIVDRPEFVDLIEAFHKAGRYEETASAQAEPGRQVVLESAQGASAPQRKSDVDWQQRVIEAAQRDGSRI